MWSCDQSMVNLSISVTEVKFNEDLTRKTTSWFKLNNLGLVLGTNLKFYTSVAKRVQTKSQKLLGANYHVCRSYRGKTGRGAFLPLPLPQS